MGQGVRFDYPESAVIIAQEFERNRPLVRASRRLGDLDSNKPCAFIARYMRL